MKTEQGLHYTACGLDNVYLLDGFHRVETGRGTVVRVEDEQGLQKAIGAFLIRQKRSLTGPELRFLRLQLGLSQPRLADLLGESEQSVARREKMKANRKRPTLQEKVLRYLFDERLGDNESLEEFLRSLADLDEQANATVEFRKDNEWAIAA